SNDAQRLVMPKVKKNSNTAANVGYEAELWRMADALRGSMDAAEYKHVVLGLIFLKYISDAFEEQHTKLSAERAQGADPEDPDEYRAQGAPGFIAAGADHQIVNVDQSEKSLRKTWAPAPRCLHENFKQA